MSGGKERINPRDLDQALDDENSVIEISFDFGSTGGSTANKSHLIYERRPKTPEDDRALGLIPELLKQPELFEQLMGQLSRGEIKDITESKDPRVQKMVAEFLQQQPSSEYRSTPSQPPTLRNPLLRAIHYFRGRDKRNSNR